MIMIHKSDFNAYGRRGRSCYLQLFYYFSLHYRGYTSFDI